MSDYATEIKARCQLYATMTDGLGRQAYCEQSLTTCYEKRDKAEGEDKPVYQVTSPDGKDTRYVQFSLCVNKTFDYASSDRYAAAFRQRNPRSVSSPSERGGDAQRTKNDFPTPRALFKKIRSGSILERREAMGLLLNHPDRDALMGTAVRELRRGETLDLRISTANILMTLAQRGELPQGHIALSVSALMKMLKAQDQVEVVQAIRTLGAFGPEAVRARPALEKLAHSERLDYSEAALKALEKIPEQKPEPKKPRKSKRAKKRKKKRK